MVMVGAGALGTGSPTAGALRFGMVAARLARRAAGVVFSGDYKT